MYHDRPVFSWQISKYIYSIYVQVIFELHFEVEVEELETLVFYLRQTVAMNSFSLCPWHEENVWISGIFYSCY